MSCALLAGISVTEARGLLPGFVMDMFKERLKYDVRLAAPKAAANLFGGM